MSFEFATYGVVTALAALLIALYWSRTARYATVRSLPLFGLGQTLLIVGGLGCCLWSALLERDRYSFDAGAEPVALAIAFDLSPSMLAIPDPQFGRAAEPRYERAKAQLLAFLRGLEESGDPAIISLIGFSREAQVIMGWNRNVAEASEVIQYALSPDLFASSGTSLEKAASALQESFAMLPTTLQDARRLAIIVSDGEDTMREASLGYAIETLADGDFGVIGMQTGLLDRNEGIPVYDRFGQFAGFRRVGRELYTRPNVAAMTAVALTDTGRGIHVRAETPAAAERMLEYAFGRHSGAVTADPAVLPVLGMFATVFLFCARVLR